MVFSSMQKQGEYKREQAGKETYGHDVNPSVMRKDLEPETISIDGQKCIKIDEWKSGEDSYLLCNSTEDSDFFYAEVNGNTHFEYDHKPDREEIEDDFIDIEAMRDIDRHEAEVFSRFEGSDDFPDIDTDAVREKLENGEFGMMSVRSIITMGTERYIPLLTEKKRRNILHRLKRKYRKRKLPSGVMWRLPRRPFMKMQNRH